MNAMINRSCPKEYIHMRGQCGGSVGKGSGEKHTSLRKVIDMRSFGELAAITAQPVCPERIYGDEKDIEFVFSFRDRIPQQCRRDNSYDQTTQKKTRINLSHRKTRPLFKGLSGNGLFSFSVSHFIVVTEIYYTKRRKLCNFTIITPCCALNIEINGVGPRDLVYFQ